MFEKKKVNMECKRRKQSMRCDHALFTYTHTRIKKSLKVAKAILKAIIKKKSNWVKF